MNERIKATADAAARLFLRQGYGKTQISHIAKAVGVSVGTIYHDFTGKEEILHLVLKGTLDPAFLEQEFQRPITNGIFAGLEGEIAAAMEEAGAEFARHLELASAGYTLSMLVSDAFDLLSRYAVGCLFIEKNQFEFPRLAEPYRAYRRHFFQTMQAYLDRFAQRGEVRPTAHPELTTTLIIEILTWWAMDMRYISFETREIPLELAKEVCMDNILAAYGR